MQTAERENNASVLITSNLTNLICDQEMDLSPLNKDAISEVKNQMNRIKEEAFQQEVEIISAEMDTKTKRLLLASREKGASSWLSELPLKKRGHFLNKQKFRDSLCLRYGWPVPGTPLYCGCAKRNTLDHILTCKRGGYVSLRHNILRNVEAKLMEEVFHDVKIEPALRRSRCDKV